MQDADKRKSGRSRRQRRRRQRGQAMVEYILLIVMSLLFARYVFFHEEFGINGLLNRMMMRLGANLEQNLKSGTGPGNSGKQPLEPYAGAGTWNN